MTSVRFHLTDGGAPKVPGLGALNDRYHYWCGLSGRRYLFTAVTAGELGDFSDAVVVFARKGADGVLGGEDVVLFGGDRTAVTERLANDGGLVAFLHLLSPTHAARQAAVEDMLGSRHSLAA